MKVHPGSSWAWKSILFGRDLIARHIAWRVGDGSMINLFNDKWILKLDKPLAHLISYNGSDNLKVLFLLNDGPNGKTWNVDRVNELILNFLVSKVLAIPLSVDNCFDQLIWAFTNSGKYSSKLGYRSLYDQQRSPLSLNVSSVWLYNGYNVWNLVWNLDLPDHIKVFIW